MHRPRHIIIANIAYLNRCAAHWLQGGCGGGCFSLPEMRISLLRAHQAHLAELKDT